MSKKIEYHHPSQKGLNLVARSSFLGVGFLLLSLFGYFYVSVFAFFSLAFLWRVYGQGLQVKVSSAGLYILSPSESLFFPWFAVQAFTPYVHEGKKAFKLTLKNHRPGLDFQVTLYSKKPRLEPLFDWQPPAFYFFFPPSFEGFYSLHRREIETFHQGSFRLYREKGEAIELKGSNLKKRSCVVDVTKPLVWPGFCPYSGKEVDSLLSHPSQPSLSLAISKKGYASYQEKKQRLYWLFLLLPSLANFMAFVFLERIEAFYGVSLVAYGTLCLGLFPLAWLVIKSLVSPVKVRLLASKKVELHFLSEDYFQSFLQANLSSPESVAPFLYQI